MTTHRADSPEQAAEQAALIGGPVALKILSPDITHKTDVGGVMLDLAGPAAVLEAANAMRERLDAIRTAPLPPDDELPELSDAQRQRLDAFALREDR